MKQSHSSLPVMETFHTIQGEGFFAGTPAFFIRLGGCDVGCTWCDVKESWNAEAHPRIPVMQLAEEAKKSGAPIVVITGGEPTMYPLGELTDLIRSNGQRTHIETSGVYPLTGTWDWITLSPKKFKPALESVAQQADEIKVIVFHKSDLAWGEEQASKTSEGALRYLQPEWDKRDKMVPLIMEYLCTHPEWKISIQTHKYLGVL